MFIELPLSDILYLQWVALTGCTTNIPSISLPVNWVNGPVCPCDANIANVEIVYAFSCIAVLPAITLQIVQYVRVQVQKRLYVPTVIPLERHSS